MARMTRIPVALLQTVSASWLVLTLLGCTSTTHIAKVREGRSAATKMQLSSLPAQTQFEDLAYLRDAAAFSAVVYAPVPVTVPLSEAKKNGTPEQKAALDLLPQGDWEEKTDIPRPGLPNVRQTPDLTYRLWVNRQSKVAILAFRGTHIPADWISNLRWITFVYPIEDHYEQTLRVTPDIVNYVKTNYGSDATIIATGHSLGGGLAQAAAYKACGAIRTVFAFDSSPVTKHRASDGCDRAPQTFYRVYEQSEILSYARLLVREVLGLRKKDPRIVEIKVHLFKGVGLTAHHMQDLAAKLGPELGPVGNEVSR